MTRQLIADLGDAAAGPGLLGGKGASLARLAAAGFPVPEGFHVTTAAYDQFVAQHGLQPLIDAEVAAVSPDNPRSGEEAARRIEHLILSFAMPTEIEQALAAAYVERLGPDAPAAVRSSATAEDLPDLSFAGQQTSYLDVRGSKAVVASVQRCWASLWSARALAYRHHHGLQSAISMAVVVQRLVAADVAGVLFTAHPVTGDSNTIMIHASWGGEAVIRGTVMADAIEVDKASRKIISVRPGKEPSQTKQEIGTFEQGAARSHRGQPSVSPAQVSELTGLGVQVEKLYQQPVDLEWAIASGQAFVLQARPITTLPVSAVPDPWNDSRDLDCLWTRGNIGEAVPDVVTPCSRSMLDVVFDDMMPTLRFGGFAPVGCIGGRMYFNLSVLMTMLAVAGFGRRRLLEATGDIFGSVPSDVEIPVLPVSRWAVAKAVLPATVRNRRRIRANVPRLREFLATTPERCASFRLCVQGTADGGALAALWRGAILPLLHEANVMLEAGSKSDGGAFIRVRKRVRKLVGQEDADLLLRASDTDELASLGPLRGLSELAAGKIDRAAFVRDFGHHSPHLFELSLPRPAEDPAWIDRQVLALRASDLDALLRKQHQAQAAAWDRFERRSPRRATGLRRTLTQARRSTQLREAARSEQARVVLLVRSFVLQAALITGIGADDIFFLTLDEILEALESNPFAITHIPERRIAYERYCTLPDYPALIRGRFDPFAWAADPHRRHDFYDARFADRRATDHVQGLPGSAGTAQGYARVATTIEEASALVPGEVLVTTVTNIGWTPLFPRASAVVTDVGAPLSHAAIVARELGIPAVLGCGNATTVLRTGDLLKVDGTRGTVQVLG
jgi:pyruvate,water dikinase